MNWSDERYVKLYERDTLTWPWQAKCVFALLLRKVDRSGVLDTGRSDTIPPKGVWLHAYCSRCFGVRGEVEAA